MYIMASTNTPLFWFIQWTWNNRGADEEAWMVKSYYRYTNEKQLIRLRIK